MNRKSKMAFILSGFFFLAFGGFGTWCRAQNAGERAPAPTFNAMDQQLIEEFYKHVWGTLAPGSINRTPFGPNVEKALVKGSKIPMQLERELAPLPKELDSQLSLLTGDYRRYKLGPHVVLVKVSDLTIADIIRNAGMKQ